MPTAARTTARSVRGKPLAAGTLVSTPPGQDAGCRPRLDERKGRGAGSNRSGRFESLSREAADDGWGTTDEPPPKLRTRLERDASRRVISYNRSPDVPFDRSINPYRGCEHGCVYCYARPTHAWLGLSPGLDFESRLFYKPDAAEQLTRELAAPGYAPAPICLGANTDPYQPVERRMHITRSVLEVLRECDHPVRIVTKAALVERDLDLLADMATRRLVSVSVSVTTLDRALSRRMEPRAAAPERRLKTIRRLSDAGIPVRLLVAPLIPALNDHQLEAIMERARDAGAAGAGYVLLRLPLEVRDLFVEWLQQHYPLREQHVMARMRDSHGGRDYEAAFGTRMTGAGPFATLIAQRFRLAANRLGLGEEACLDSGRFRPPAGPVSQLSLL
jgi:DNA repair photolyase